MTAGSSHWFSDDETKPAPEPLNRIQALVNSVEWDFDRDRLADPAEAVPWLVRTGLLTPGAELTEPDVELLRGVREALRAVLVHNTGGPAPAEAQLAPLRRLAARGAARVALADDGGIELAPEGDSVADRLFDLLLIIRDAQRDGSWVHLKACANEDCRWAFYDRSRNHGGTWCDMATCGNKIKNREFRARRRAAEVTSTDAIPGRRPARRAR
ncbi:CGNR zinc finger domain-containing protein [Mycobacterium sp. B14F4]|uniref:CGNR zinc finger domain-containing protein n=1 Tax=Mycobacterium sp. B14F4 TaxID=3153565 RepID=UPI00325D3967